MAWPQASKIEFIDGSHSIGHDMIYSTCRRADRQEGDWNPAWYIRGEKIIIDTEADEGYVENGALAFLWRADPADSRWLGFPPSDKRRSGLPPPTSARHRRRLRGRAAPRLQYRAQPRCHRHAHRSTASAAWILFGQFRYLEDTYAGNLQANYLPGDNLRDNLDRWHYVFQHAQDLPSVPERTASSSSTCISERVSDDNVPAWISTTSTAATRC